MEESSWSESREMSIICSDDDEKSYCDDCDYLLIERKDGSSICSNCQRIYSQDNVTKHKSKLVPEIDPYRNEGPELVSITGYADPKKKKPTIGDIEDQHWVRQGKGRKILEVDEWVPE